MVCFIQLKYILDFFQFERLGFENITWILLDEGVRVDVKDNNGDTPLNLALKNGEYSWDREHFLSSAAY